MKLPQDKTSGFVKCAVRSITVVALLVLLTLGSEAILLDKNGMAVGTAARQLKQKTAMSEPVVNQQNMDQLKQFSMEDLLREVRARESNSTMVEFSDSILERHADEDLHQPIIKITKLNPLLKAYPTTLVVEALVDKQKAIYGQDNRKDVFLISSDPKLKQSADAVVALFHVSRIVALEDGKNSKIVKKLYGTEFRLCETEPFYAQPCSAFCSGVLVAPNVIATAGHCIDTPSENTPPLKDIRFVFGYRMRDATNAETIINNNEIYSAQQVIQRVYSPNGADWALIKLDRPVTGHLAVPIRRSATIQDAEDLYVIGHPCGLPAKFADGATVRINSNADFFIANLDTYGGNSGSPVFDRNTHQVEGILVRGERDFVSQNSSSGNSCQVSLSCPDTGCSGEACTRTTLFAYLIPQ